MNDIMTVLIKYMDWGCNVGFELVGYDQYKITLTKSASGRTASFSSVLPLDHLNSDTVIRALGFMYDKLYQELK